MLLIGWITCIFYFVAIMSSPFLIFVAVIWKGTNAALRGARGGAKGAKVLGCGGDGSVRSGGGSSNGGSICSAKSKEEEEIELITKKHH